MVGRWRLEGSHVQDPAAERLAHMTPVEHETLLLFVRRLCTVQTGHYLKADWETLQSLLNLILCSSYSMQQPLASCGEVQTTKYINICSIIYWMHINFIFFIVIVVGSITLEIAQGWGENRVSVKSSVSPVNRPNHCAFIFRDFFLPASFNKAFNSPTSLWVRWALSTLYELSCCGY